MRSGEMAKRLGVSSATIRNWTDTYADYLSERGRGVQPGATREFSAEDARLLATVAHHKNLGLTHEQIKENILDKGTRLEPPELPTAEEEEVRSQVALVPVAELQRALDLLRVKEVELERVIEERDSARIELSTANTRIEELREEIGYLRAQVDQYQLGGRRLSPIGFFLVALVLVVLIGVALAVVTAIR